MEPVTNPDNPQQQDVSGQGTNQAPNDDSTSTLPAADVQTATDTAQDAVVDYPAADAAKQSRLEQENADLRRLANKMGVDPDSQQADYIVKGLMQPEDLRPAQPATQQQGQEPPASPIDLNQKLLQIKDRFSVNKPVTETSYRDDMNAMFDVVQGLVKDKNDINQQLQSSQMADRQKQNIEASTTTFRNSEIYNFIPEDVRDIGSQMVLGASDIDVGKLAQQVGFERAFTTDGYEMATKKVLLPFEKFVKSIYDAGRNAALKSMQPSNEAPSTVSAGTGAPAVPGGQKFTQNDLKANVQKYMQGRRLNI